ncbi:MAG: hypothetical protein A2521_08605 [Deltaproteobacteria bacterium RIFOXYD12_FULL_57_12]|nr:MAG: hypothetical protein A2521_08605 [Deltaproteobacteria bacterium RIFOXYD12_FULL_57_12]
MVVAAARHETKKRNFFRRIHERNEKRRQQAIAAYNQMVIKYKLGQFFLTRVLPALIALSLVFIVIRHREVTSPIAPGRQPAQEHPGLSDSTTKQPLRGQGKIYSWTDDSGITHFSNTKFPENRNVREQAELSANQKETAVVIQRNQVLVPVMIGHNGKLVKTTLLLDTGCSGLFLHDDLAGLVNPRTIGRGKAIVADGRHVDTEICAVDLIQVGPYSEKNIQVETSHIENKEKLAHNGLLGMAFLKKHPFQIDYKRSVIVWQ